MILDDLNEYFNLAAIFLSTIKSGFLKHFVYNTQESHSYTLIKSILICFNYMHWGSLMNQ